MTTRYQAAIAVTMKKKIILFNWQSNISRMPRRTGIHRYILELDLLLEYLGLSKVTILPRHLQVITKTIIAALPQVMDIR